MENTDINLINLGVIIGTIMNTFKRSLLATFMRAIICFLLSTVSLTMVSLIDGIRMGEALGYAVVVGVVGSLFGGLLGLIIASLRQGAGGGALAGLLMVVFPILFYVLAFSRPGQVMSFIGESIIFPVVMSIPFTMTGFLVGLVNKRNFMYSK